MKRKPHWTYTGTKRRLLVLKRDNYECQIRGPQCTGIADTVDHIHPKAWGGTEDVSNLRAACWSCNQRKGMRTESGSFFKGSPSMRAPLAKIHLRSPWGVVAHDYSRGGKENGR